LYFRTEFDFFRRPEVEIFKNKNYFIKKASLYNLWFSNARKNSYRENQTPWKIANKINPKLNPKLQALTPVFLDNLYFPKNSNNKSRGYDVVPHPYISPCQ